MTLITNSGHKISKFNVAEGGKMLLNSTMLIYGMRRTGKTTLIRALMHACKPFVSFYYVVSMSAQYNGDYDDMVPRRAIQSSVSIEWMEQLVAEQKKRASLYKIANDKAHLTAVFNQIKNPTPHSKYNRLKTIFNQKIAQLETIRSNGLITDERYQMEMKGLRDMFDEQSTVFFKSQIQTHVTELRQQIAQGIHTEHSWPPEWQILINYIDFVPHIFIVFDDCSAAIRKWATKMPSFREIFFNGRHIFITIVITGHTVASILPDLRTNATFTFCTSSNVVGPLFKGDQFSREELKTAVECAEKIFHEKAKHYKFMYYSEDPDSPFKYLTSKTENYGRVGSDAQWSLDNKLEEVGRATLHRYPAAVPGTSLPRSQR